MTLSWFVPATQTSTLCICSSTVTNKYDDELLEHAIIQSKTTFRLQPNNSRLNATTPRWSMSVITAHVSVSYARFVILIQPPHSRRWLSHSSTPDWTMATACSLVSQFRPTSCGDYSLFSMRQRGLSSISDAPITSVMR